MKKFIPFVLLLSCPTFAAKTPSVQPCSNAFQGVYVAGNVGYGEGGSLTKFINAMNNALDNINDLGFNGIDGGVGTGYIHRSGPWAVGISFDANWTNVTGEHKHINEQELIGASLRNSLQLYARAGYVFCERIMPFLGLGWDNSLWQLNSAHTNAANITNRDRVAHRQNSLLWKAGIDFLIESHVAMGFEYTGTVSERKNYFYPTQEFVDSWKPQYNKYALTLKVIPFAGPSSLPSSQQAPLQTCQKSFQGIHLGGNIGYGSIVGRRQKFKNDTISRKGIVNLTGVDGGVSVGYTRRLDAWALGLSFDANLSNASGKRVNTQLNKAQLVYLNNSLQLYARMGYVFFERIMPFIGLGWDNSAWTQTLQDRGLTEKTTKRHNALLWKVGSEFLITKCFIAGLEYTGTMAQQKRYVHGPNFIDSDTGTPGQISNSWQPQYNKFALTAKFIFD